MSAMGKLLDRLFGVPKLASFPAAGAVVIMVIRHGEKPPIGGAQGWTAPSGGKADSHSLTMQGWARAKGLVALFSAWATTNGARPDLWTPTHLYAADGPSAGERMRQTISLLATALGKTIILAYDKGKYKNLVKALNALQSGARALVSWEHSEIPKIAGALKAKGYPSSWPDNRFDVVWVFTSDGKGGWTWSERPEMVLPGDKASGIKGNPLTYPRPAPPAPPVTPPPVEPPVDPNPPADPPPVIPPPVTPPPALLKPSDVIDLSGWKLDYAPHVHGAGLVTLQATALVKGTDAPGYFEVGHRPKDGFPEVVFTTNAGDATTPTSTYSRAELREMVRAALGGMKLAAWSTESGTHSMTVIGRAIAIPDGTGGVVIGQIHNKDEDQLEILLMGNGSVTARIMGTSKGQKVLPAPIGDRYTYRVMATKGVVVGTFNGAELFNTTKIVGEGSYFKAGNYLNMKSGQSKIGISQLIVSHSPDIS